MDFDYNFAIQVIVIFLIVLILFALIMQYSKKKDKQVNKKTPATSKKEEFEDMQKNNTGNYFPSIAPNEEAYSQEAQDEAMKEYNKNIYDDMNFAANSKDIKAAEPQGNEDYQAVEFGSTPPNKTDYPKDRLTKDDLLPKDAANSIWAQVNPAGQGNVEDNNLLSAGHHIGINTVGNSLRNANHQLRSDPPIPKIQGLSPWNNTTIDYDSNRRPFEIGEP